MFCDLELNGIDREVFTGARFLAHSQIFDERPTIAIYKQNENDSLSVMHRQSSTVIEIATLIVLKIENTNKNLTFLLIKPRKCNAVFY